MAINYGTIIDGAARSDNINQDGLPVDMEAQTALLDPNSYLLEALTRQLGSAIEAKQMKHEFRERRLIPNFTTIAVADSAAETHIEVANHSRIKNDFLLYLPVQDQLLLVQDASIDATVTIVDAVAGSGGLSSGTNIGDPVVILGEAHAEGEEVPSAYTVQSISKFNYIMQKDRRVEASDIEEAIEHYDSREHLALDRKQAWIEYKRDQNLLYYVGKGTREIVTASGARRHVCSGLLELLTENRRDLSGAGGGLTLATIGNLLRATKYHGASSQTKIGIFGTNGFASISAWPQDALRVSPMSKKWGIKINTVITPFGELNIAYDPVLEADKGLEDRGFILDGGWLRPMRLQGLPVRMYLNVPNLKTLHKRADAISGTFGLQAKFPELHSQIEGIGQ